MRLTWLGHSGFRVEIAGQVLLLDPWLRGNPTFDAARFDEAVAGATAILLSHGHDDHAATAPEIARATGAPVCAIYDLAGWLARTHGIAVEGLNKGGAVAIGEVRATLVHATHSSSTTIDGRPVCLGSACGWVIAGEGRTIYFAGDTDVHADMGLIAELHRPDIGILPIGGRFTMDAARAAFAARRFFDFRAVIPCHYRTFGQLAQSADAFVAAMAPTPVHAPEVMVPIEL